VSKIVDINSRRERWHSAYSVVGLSISVSNHGRMYLELEGKTLHLDMTDAVALMSQVSDAYDKVTEF
jgi:hypothetical protein